MSWYQKAAAQNYAPAQVNLGAMYAEGRGVARDFHEALKWYQAAAAQDYAPGQFNLGVMYFQGYNDLVPDLPRACLWFARAARQGDHEAEYMRNKVEGRLTTRQRAQVRELLETAVEDETA
jgi:hypothetical protein